MPSYYSVIRYVPDPVADEAINVGVVAFQGSTVVLRWTSDWWRARQLANRDPVALKEVAADLYKQADSGKLTESAIRRYADTWHNEIQWTSPRASARPVEDLANEVAALYLRKVER